ncbi:facilitated trehalose transporter Tret1-2 homolog [Condylostylus longicornis]|uniref:facilitated trehalose transporter Tret1-2 homolog n=1 Tax=Condylostylus longicornis TaxID=2530218 RepID=UPI00244E1ACE|nr:facilitated trehalose transporter Tret1-2 homolog [Condylostylus longicornis]
MDTDKVVSAMARWWQTVSQEDNDPSARNPMLYDPLQEGQTRTSKTMQYVAAIVVCLGAVSAGTALAWTSPVLPQLTIDLSAINETIETPEAIEKYKELTNSTGLYLDGNERSWVSSLLAIGAFCGAVPSGFVADLIGRKYTALVMDIPFIVAWISIIFASGPGALYFGRFLIGLATGSYCVIAPMYISEIAETSIRGSLGTFFQLFLTIGILLVYLFGSFVTWKTLSTLCLFIPLALFVSMFFLPETPTYLLKKGRRGDAALSLKWLWGHYCDSRSAIQAIQSDLDSSAGEASLTDLFTNIASRKALIIGFALMFFQQFSGINAVIFYTVPIFKSAGSTLDADVCSIIVGIVQVLMTFVSSLLIERAGRKMLLLFSSTIMCICLAILGAYFQMKDNGKDVSSIGWLPLLCVVMFIVTFSIGYGPIPWLMMGELFLPSAKGTASSLIVMFNWTSVFIVTKCFDKMISSFGSDFTFWTFGAMMALGTVFVSIVVFETKGRSSAQIQMQLSGEKPGEIF